MSPRKKEGSKHPALMRSVNRGRDFGTFEEKELEALQGWHTFTENQKKFLALRPWFNTDAATQQYMGVNAFYAVKSKQNNPHFKLACDTRMGAGVRFVRQMANDLLGMSVLALKDMVEDSSSKSNRLAAVQHLHKLTGLTDDRPQVNTQVNLNGITLFKGAPDRLVGEEQQAVIEG